MLNWTYIPYTVPLILSGIAALALGVYAARHRNLHGATAFTWLCLAASEWAFTYALEIYSPSLLTKVFWAKLEYLGITAGPLCWLAFAVYYTRRDRLFTARRWALLSLIPLITLALVFTNEWHGLIWRQITLDLAGPFPALHLDYGEWFWVHTAASYLYVLVGSVLLLTGLVEAGPFYRRQRLALIVGIVTPWIGNLLYIAKVSPVRNLDLTPLAATLAAVAFALALFSFRLLDLVPVARRATLDSMSDAVIVLDAQNRIQDLNKTASRIIGVGHTDAIGQPAGQVLGQHRDLLERFANTREVQTEIVRSTANGPRYFELQIAPLRDVVGQYSGRLITLHDVTERKHADEEIRRLTVDLEHRVAERTAELEVANRELQNEIADRKRATKQIYFQAQVLDQVQTAIAATDREGRVTYWNAQAEKLYGWKAGEVLGKMILELPVWNAEMELTSRIAELLLLQGSWQGEFTPCRKDDSTFPAYGTIAVIRDDEGQVLGVVGAALDISDRKRAEQERETLLKQLEAEHALLETVLGSAPVGLVLFDTDMRVVGLNAEYASMMGLDAHLMRGRSAYDLIPWVQSGEGLHRRALEGESVDEQNIAHRTPGGEVRYFDLRYRPVHDDTGRVTGLVSALTDVTARRQVEQQKDEFIALASHELRTPLTSIKGFAKVGLRLAQAARDDRMLRALRVIDEQSDRLARLVNDLLDVSLMEQGLLPLHTSRVDLNELAREVVDSMELSVPDFRFCLDLSPMPLVVIADLQRIEEVLTNLIVNAVKYSRDRREISISLSRVDNEAVAAVRDYGVGIPADQQKRVFERFYRGTNASAGARSGLGLGLFLSREIVQQHGGRIWFESEYEVGSTFYFALPLAPE